MRVTWGIRILAEQSRSDLPCDENVLVQTWGTALGQTLFAQSREAPPAPPRQPGQHRSKITLATLSDAHPAPFADEDDADDVDDMAEPAGFVVHLN